jgi:hypothetical protein
VQLEPGERALDRGVIGRHVAREECVGTERGLPVAVAFAAVAPRTVPQLMVEQPDHAAVDGLVDPRLDLGNVLATDAGHPLHAAFGVESAEEDPRLLGPNAETLEALHPGRPERDALLLDLEMQLAVLAKQSDLVRARAIEPALTPGQHSSALGIPFLVDAAALEERADQHDAALIPDQNAALTKAQRCARVPQLLRSESEHDLEVALEQAHRGIELTPLAAADQSSRRVLAPPERPS